MRMTTGFVAVVVATTMVAGIVVVSVQEGAGASSPTTGMAVTCSAIRGVDAIGRTLTVSGCTGATGGTGTIAGPFFTPSKIHWASGGKSKVTFDPTPRQVGICPTGSSPFKLSGGAVVSSGVPDATGSFHASFCIDPTGHMSLQAGTLMRF